MISLKRLKLGAGGDKIFYLMVLDGLAVSMARRFIERGYFFTSIADFAAWWLIHFFAVILFAVFAAAAVIHWRKFWLGDAAERNWSIEEAMFAVLMTVLVRSIFLVVVASVGPPDEFGD